MKRHELTREYLMDYWLGKYHNTSVKEVIAKHPPEVLQDPKWFRMYECTQEQHDEWYDWAIDVIAKTHRMSKKLAKRSFAFDYLNCSPNVIRDDRSDRV